MHATVIIRDAKGLLPKLGTVVARWYAPDGRRIRSQTLDLPAHGLATASLVTRGASSTGAWRLEIYEPNTKAVIGKGVFRVEPFVPDRMEAVVTSTEPMRFGVQATLRVRANWLEGSPAAKRPGRLYVSFDHGKHVVPGFENFNQAVRGEGGFVLPSGPGRREFATASGRANFSVHPLPVCALEPGQFLMTTIRSHDQFNTTVYSSDDRYRGIRGNRRVVFISSPGSACEPRNGVHL